MSSSTNPAQSSTNLFRRLAWQSSIQLFIRLADGEPGAGSGSDRYYMQAPRYTYLPLLLPEIRENLVELALDDQELADTDEKDWWFEEEVEEGSGTFSSQGACRWHWPLDLIDMYSYISRPVPTIPSSSKSRPLRLLLHFSNPPADKLLLGNTIEACKTQYINQVKEADFVRWRNTSRVTNLRRADLEAGWDGIMQDDYDLYMRMASRILPLPIPNSAAGTPSGPSRPPSTDPGSSGPSKPESSYGARALPIKIHLPDNAPVIQEVIPPLLPDGAPLSLIGMLSQHLPLLFPSGGKTSPYSLAIPFAQGIELPPEAEVAWLSACLCGVDGWLRIGIQLRSE